MKFHYVVDRIPLAGLDVEDHLDAAWVGGVLGDTFRAVGDSFPLRFALVRHDWNVKLDGEVELTYEFACSRCAEDVRRTLTLPLHWSWAQGAEPAPKEDEESFDVDTWGLEEGREVTLYEGTEIDIEPSIVDQIAFALPAWPLCREDCKGLCPNCGQNLNEASCTCAQERVDPRLAKLKDLKLGG